LRREKSTTSYVDRDLDSILLLFSLASPATLRWVLRVARSLTERLTITTALVFSVSNESVVFVRRIFPPSARQRFVVS